MPDQVDVFDQLVMLQQFIFWNECAVIQNGNVQILFIFIFKNFIIKDSDFRIDLPDALYVVIGSLFQVFIIPFFMVKKRLGKTARIERTVTRTDAFLFILLSFSR